MRPLDGLTVVALEQAVAAPFATRQLADRGARVIKIERPDGGDFARHYDRTVAGWSSHFVWLNRSKESLTLDLKRAEARDVLAQVLDRADVFVQNLAPGAADRLGLGGDALRARHPRLIVCGISGYGTTGPQRDRKAYDLLVQAEAGLLSVTGSADEPAKVGVSVADIAAGMYALTGILTALVARGRTGRGTVLDISMLEALGEWMGYPLYYTTYGGAPPPRSGPRHATIAPYGPFVARDGDVVFVAVQNEREWEAFCGQVLSRSEVASDPRFASNPLRVEHRDALDGLVAGMLATLPVDDLLTRLDRARVAHARLRTVAQFAEHPQLAARGRWRDVETPVGPVRALIPPDGLEAVEPRMDPVPALGEHTDAILGDLGYDARTVAAWRAAGIV